MSAGFAAPLAATLDGFTQVLPDGPIHIHAAEQVKDVDDHVAYAGAHAWRFIGQQRGWALVPCPPLIWTPAKLAVLPVRRRGRVVLTARATGRRLFPSDYLDAGGAWGIESDSHVSVSPLEELRWLEYGQRLISRTRNIAASGTGSPGARLFADTLEQWRRLDGHRRRRNGNADLVVLTRIIRSSVEAVTHWLMP